MCLGVPDHCCGAVHRGRHHQPPRGSETDYQRLCRGGKGQGKAASDYSSILIVPFHQSAKFGNWVGATVEKNPWNVYKIAKFIGK